MWNQNILSIIDYTSTSSTVACERARYDSEDKVIIFIKIHIIFFYYRLRLSLSSSCFGIISFYDYDSIYYFLPPDHTLAPLSLYIYYMPSRKYTEKEENSIKITYYFSLSCNLHWLRHLSKYNQRKVRVFVSVSLSNMYYQDVWNGTKPCE